MKINISKMTVKEHGAKRILFSIRHNLASHSSGNGNKAKRRAGIPVADSTEIFCGGMVAKEKAEFFKDSI